MTLVYDNVVYLRLIGSCEIDDTGLIVTPNKSVVQYGNMLTISDFPKRAKCVAEAVRRKLSRSNSSTSASSDSADDNDNDDDNSTASLSFEREDMLPAVRLGAACALASIDFSGGGTCRIAAGFLSSSLDVRVYGAGVFELPARRFIRLKLSIDDAGYVRGLHTRTDLLNAKVLENGSVSGIRVLRQGTILAIGRSNVVIEADHPAWIAQDAKEHGRICILGKTNRAEDYEDVDRAPLDWQHRAAKRARK